MCKGSEANEFCVSEPCGEWVGDGLEVSLGPRCERSCSPITRLAVGACEDGVLERLPGSLRADHIERGGDSSEMIQQRRGDPR